MSDNNMVEIITEATEEVTSEMTADQLLAGTDGAQDAPQDAENPPETDEQADEAEHTEEAEKPAEDGRRTQYVATLRELVSVGGFTKDELDALSKDETVIKDLNDGKSLWAAAFAYRARTAPAQKPAKRAVPSVKKAAAEGRTDEDDLSAKIDKMSSKEFAEFMARAEGAAMSGKRVSIR